MYGKVGGSRGKYGKVATVANVTASYRVLLVDELHHMLPHRPPTLRVFDLGDLGDLIQTTAGK